MIFIGGSWHLENLILEHPCVSEVTLVERRPLGPAPNATDPWELTVQTERYQKMRFYHGKQSFDFMGCVSDPNLRIMATHHFMKDINGPR